MHTLRIDGYIGREDNASIFGGEKPFSLKTLNAFLDAVPAGTTELKIEINSGGGSVTEGFAIHDRLVASGLELYTEILGLCGSISTIIALSAKQENRSMHVNSDYFIHNPYWQPTSPTPMEAKDLEAIAEDLKNSEEKILKFYAEKTGKPILQIKAFMDKAKSFTAEEAKEMGFISEIKGESVAKQKYLIAAFVDRKQIEKTTDMDFTPKQKSWIEEQFNGFTKKFNKFFTPVFNAMTELESGGKIWIDGEGEDLKGKKVYTVDEAGNKTNELVADGDYPLKDGKTIVVMDGTITEVKEKAPDEVAALKAKITELEGQLATTTEAKAQVETDLAAEKKITSETIVALKAEVTQFKNMVLGKEIPGKEEQEFKGGDTKKDVNQEWLAINRKNFEQKAKAKK